MDKRDAIARSRVYKIQLDAVRLKIWDLDEKCSNEGLSSQEDREYEALETTERRILRNWRTFRRKAGLSNEAVS